MLGILSPKLLSEVAPPARRGGFYRIKIRHRTKFAASYSIGKLTCVVPNEKQFTGRNPSSCTRRRSIRLSPIVEYSRLQPPVGVWTVTLFHNHLWCRLCLHPDWHRELAYYNFQFENYLFRLSE